MNHSELLSRLPAVDQLLLSGEVTTLAQRFPASMIKGWVRGAIEHHRELLLAATRGNVDQEISTWDETALSQAIIGHVLAKAERERRSSMQSVINATGILLHTNLGRAPLAEAAMDAMRDVSRYTNLELDLDSGKRSRRGERACRLLATLTGTDDAIVVNNCAAATYLALQTLAGKREVIVSRGQLVEIGGGFRLPDVFESAGAILREVGTTNRTYLNDYDRAIGEQTGAILRVHRSNFSQSGFVTEPGSDELAALAKQRELPFIDDLGSGLVTDLTSLGIDEPTVQDSLRSGADICLFSGDKLLAGPQCGIIAGKSRWIDLLKKHPIMRTVRVDKATLAALEATVEIHLQGRAKEDLPLFQMLFESEQQLLLRANRLANALKEAQVIANVEESIAQIGGGSLPGTELTSYAVGVRSHSVQKLALALRSGRPAILCRQADDKVVIDLRSVMADQLDVLIARVVEAAAESSERA